MMSKNRKFSLALWGVAGLVLLLGLGWAAMPRPLLVPAVAVQEGALSVEVVDLGVTRVKDLFAVSAPVAGYLERIALQPGDSVSAGQVVARLRAAPATPLDERRAAETAAAVQSAQARVDEARARLETLKSELARNERLGGQGYVSGSVLEQARSAMREGEARLASARADLRQAQASASQRLAPAGSLVEVRAPVGGTVLKRVTQSEAVLPAGTALIELGDVRALEVAGDFLSADAQRVAVGAKARFVVPGQAPVAGKVTRVEPAGERKISALGVEEQRVKVIVALDEVPAGLGHGYQGDTRIETTFIPRALLLPVEALVRDGAAWSVMRIRDGRAERVTVETGPANGVQRQIRSGLALGDLVIVAPPAGLKAGQRVEVAK